MFILYGMKYLYGLSTLICSLCSVASIFIYVYIMMFRQDVIYGWARITLLSYIMAGVTALFILLTILCLENLGKQNKDVKIGNVAGKTKTKSSIKY